MVRKVLKGPLCQEHIGKISFLNLRQYRIFLVSAVFHYVFLSKIWHPIKNQLQKSKIKNQKYQKSTSFVRGCVATGLEN